MANPFTVQPLGGLQNVANIQRGMQGIAQNFQADEAEEQKQALMQQASEVFERGDPKEIAQFSMQNPEVGKAMMGGIKFQDEVTEQNLKKSMQGIIAGRDPVQILQNRIQTVESRGGDASDSRRELEVLKEMGPEQYRSLVQNEYAMAFGEEGLPGAGDQGEPAGVREIKAKLEAAELEPGTERYKEALLIELGLEPRAGISATERMANNPALAARVAELEAQLASAKETGKLETQQELMPKIRADIAQAEQQAKSRGEDLTDLARAEAAMPTLMQVVDNLADLSDVATYTWGGKMFDKASKELGFGATEGSTARAQMSSIVNNQVLPLLKSTFGGVVSDFEITELKNTLIDMDAAPSEKKAILQAFIDSKTRELKEKRRRLEGADSGGGGAEVSKPVSEMTDEELMNQAFGGGQ